MSEELPMSDLKIRWRLFADESEPTSRERGMRVYEELRHQGWDADFWDGRETADIIVLQYDMRALDGPSMPRRRSCGTAMTWCSPAATPAT
jgi:hypothetical protein